MGNCKKTEHKWDKNYLLSYSNLLTDIKYNKRFVQLIAKVFLNENELEFFKNFLSDGTLFDEWQEKAKYSRNSLTRPRPILAMRHNTMKGELRREAPVYITPAVMRVC